MNVNIKTLLIVALAITNLSCGTQKKETFKPKEVYKSNTLIVLQIAENSFKHTSFKQTNDFGNVPCNGLIVRNNNEVVVFDTPTNDKNSQELITWIKEVLHSKIKAVVPTHFHDDCLGGLKAFHENDVPSYGYFKTIELAKENNLVAPIHSFKDSLILKIGKNSTITRFFGEGHTRDNVVSYFPSENILFGGCLVKELGASKGYLGDANVADWSATVRKIKKQYPNLSLIVPGHGNHGNNALLDYTITLFNTNQ